MAAISKISYNLNSANDLKVFSKFLKKFINFFQLKTGKGFSRLLLLFGSQPSEVDKFLDNEQWHSKGSFLQEENF